MRKVHLKSNSGFTITEILVSLVLIILGLCAVSGMLSYIADLTASQKVEESLEGVAVATIEDYKHILDTTQTLKTGKAINSTTFGNTSCTVTSTVTALAYEGAYKIEVIVKSDTDNSISREVLLYAEAKKE